MYEFKKHLHLENHTKKQIQACIDLLQEVLGDDLLGVYLYGSSIVGGLQKYSDIDLFVISNRETAYQEKATLVTHLLSISGVYKKSSKRPIEMTIVVKSEVNPWHYPPKFDFQYGDWLREKFESGNIEPWPTKQMPDLALLITQVLLVNRKLFGENPNQLLCNVPYKDFITASLEALDDLIANLNTDTCNVLLTLARIWSTVKTDRIYSKPGAASWVINQLPEEYTLVIKRASAISAGEENEYWGDLQPLIQACAQFMMTQINEQVFLLKSSDYSGKNILIKN